MSITEEVSFDNNGEALPSGKQALWRRLFLSLVIILTALLSFGLGILLGGGKSEPVRIEYDPTLASPQSNPQANKTSAGEVYASSSGKRYYYANCPGLSRISAQNKISFPNSAVAEAAGFSLASGCNP